MKKLLNSMGARVAAFIFCVLFAWLLIASVITIAVLYIDGAYDYDADTARAELFYGWCDSQSRDTLAYFAADGSTEDIQTDSAFAYTITDSSGTEVCSTLDGRDFLLSTSVTMDYVVEYDESTPMESGVEIHRGDDGNSAYVWSSKSVNWSYEDDEDAAAAADPLPEDAESASGVETEASDEAEAADASSFDYTRTPYSITGYVLKDIPESSSIFTPVQIFNRAYVMRYAFLVCSVLSMILCVALFVYLMAAAGRREPDGEIIEGFTERIPFDIFTLGIMLLCGAALVLSAKMMEIGVAVNVVQLTFVAVVMAGCVVLALWWCMSFAVHIKLRTVIKSCLCYKIAAWFWRIIKKLFSLIAYIFSCIPLVPRAVLIVLGVYLVELIFMTSVGDNAAKTLGWVFERAVLLALVIYVLAAMKGLITAGKEIAGGNMDYRVDTTKLLGPLKEHGEDLNSIGDGLNKAIAGKVKSERFRTELITNVSHDIKTPLTSIINYVDLLEKEKIDNPRAQEYLEVLARQSARLKKLITDLLEASKASTGNLPVNPERCELGVLLEQTAGEYVEKLEQAGLELVENKPEEPVYIMADRQHLWRIFDNLMNNTCKYSQPGTRVYLELSREPASAADGRTKARAVVTFRNISKTKLNVSEEELMERFVRGDSSRNTEGSGLGLSIANSLTKLQNGEMTLTVDGDLFKVRLLFDIAE